MRLLPRSHSIDFMRILRFSPKWHQKFVYHNTNRQVRKETKTDMESATFKTCSIHAKHGKVRSTLQKQILLEIKNSRHLIWHMAQKTIHVFSDAFKQWPRSKIILIYMSMMMLLKQLWICVLLIIIKIKKYDIWISRMTFRDSWTLANLIRIQCPVRQ